MARIARTPAEVIASEISYASPETSWADALAIASVVNNRALALGVTAQQVVGVQREFNAFGKAMPAGANVDLAQQAIDNVNQFGPTTAATFYAMPRAVNNLPATRQFDMAVPGGHQYFTEPTNGAIKTTLGFRAPTDIATVNAAAAQRKAYDVALAEQAGFPTPEERPDILPVTQNPALLAAMPLSQIDPATLDALPAATGVTAPPDLALAQNLQSPAMAGLIDSPQALQAALGSLATGIAGQRDFMPTVETAKTSRIGQPTAVQAAQAAMPNVDVQKGARIGTVDAARFGDMVGPVAHSVKTVSIPGQINSPQALSDAVSVMGLEQGMDAQRSTMPTVDVAKGDRAIASPQSRFAEAPAGAISPEDISRAFFNPTGFSQLDPSFTEGLMSPSNPVVPTAVQTATLTPETINSPEALSAALSAISSAAAPVSAPSANNPLEAAVDNAVRGPTPSVSNAETALQAAIDGAVRGPTPSSFSMTNNPLQAALDTAAKSPSPAVSQVSGGLNSPDMQQVRENVERQLQEYQKPSDEANAAGGILSFDRTSIPPSVAPSLAAESSLADGLEAQNDRVAQPTAIAQVQATPSASMTPEQMSGYNQMAQEGFYAGLTNLSGHGRINGFGKWTSNIEPSASDFAAEVQAGLPAQLDRYDKVRELAAEEPGIDTRPDVLQEAMIETGHSIPVPTPNPLAVAPAVTPALPALETVDVVEQPTVAAPVEDPAPAAITAPATESVPGATSSMPAVQQRQSTAMDVWSGKSSSGVATDGSTVSRLDDGRIGRYVPSFDYTTFSTDDGSTWSSPVAGNQLAPKTSPMATIQPAVSQSLISRLVSVLTGTGVSPTDVAPAGLDGGTSFSRAEQTVAPGGWGPGGSATNPGSAGGYGSTNGVDPNGTR